MSHDVVTVEFGDGSRCFAVNNGSGCYLYRFLVRTRQEALDIIADGNIQEGEQPENAVASEEPVILHPDDPWAFTSRASRSAFWITGPRNSDEKLEEEGFSDVSIYG